MKKITLGIIIVFIMILISGCFSEQNMKDMKENTRESTFEDLHGSYTSDRTKMILKINKADDSATIVKEDGTKDTYHITIVGKTLAFYKSENSDGFEVSGLLFDDRKRIGLKYFGNNYLFTKKE